MDLSTGAFSNSATEFKIWIASSNVLFQCTPCQALHFSICFSDSDKEVTPRNRKSCWDNGVTGLTSLRLAYHKGGSPPFSVMQ
jgi:hypothetical protein